MQRIFLPGPPNCECMDDLWRIETVELPSALAIFVITCTTETTYLSISPEAQLL